MPKGRTFRKGVLTRANALAWEFGWCIREQQRDSPCLVCGERGSEGARDKGEVPWSDQQSLWV